MSLESICLAQRSMLVEEALIGPLPFFQEQMSEMGQTEKNSVRANVFRVTPESGHCSMRSAYLKGAINGHLARSSNVHLHAVCGFQLADRPWSSASRDR